MIEWRVIHRGWKTNTESVPTCCLLQTPEGIRIVVNPSLRGDVMRQHLFNRSGLEPGAINMVLCLDADPCHRADFEIFHRAVYRMPAEALSRARQTAAGENAYFLSRFQPFSAGEAAGISLRLLDMSMLLYGLEFLAKEGNVLIVSADLQSENTEKYTVIVPEYGKFRIAMGYDDYLKQLRDNQ
jgi:hypothetical protein